MPSRIPRGLVVFGSLILAFVIAFAVVFTIDEQSGLAYTLTFDDTGGLEPGHPVKLGGVEIGQVKAVRPGGGGVRAEVDVRVFPEYRGKVLAPPNSSGRVRQGSLLFGKPYVEIVNRAAPPEAESMTSQAVVEGLDGWTEEKLWQTDGKADEAWERALALGHESLDRLEDWARSEEGTALRERVGGFLDVVESFAGDTDEPIRDRLDRMISEAEALVAMLDRKNKPQVAGDVERTLEVFLSEGDPEMDPELRAKVTGVLEELRRVNGEGTVIE